MSYRYAASDPRAVRGRYFYAEFEGEAFLAAYADSRRLARSRLAAVGAADAPRPRLLEPRIAEPGAEPIDTLSVLAAAVEAASREAAARSGITSGGSGAAATMAASRVAAAMATSGTAATMAASRTAAMMTSLQTAADAGDAWLSVLTRKFEVGRVLRAGYGADLRPIDRTEVAPDAYVFLGTLLARRAGASVGAPGLGALSSLLKVGDLLDWIAASDIASLSTEAAGSAAEALAIEGRLVDLVAARTFPRAGPPACADGRGPDVPDSWSLDGTPLPTGPMTLLAADTARARAYLDLLAREGLLPDRAVVVDLRESVLAGSALRPQPTPMFDNVTPLPMALARAGVPTARLVVDRFEDAPVLRALDEAGASLVVVAAPPGVILAPVFFEGGRTYLHVHPGRLPDYRGSTPMYYEYLAEGSLTATALLLDAGLDTGSIVGARSFEPPADMTTIDGAFDPWMRASMLLDVIRARASAMAIAARPQGAAPGHTYQVIHPVLRHIALLRSAARPLAAGSRQGA